MKLSNKPKILYVYDPDYGNFPYPYMFSCIPNLLKTMDVNVEFFDIANATLEKYKKAIDEYRPELLLGFIQNIDQVFKFASFLKEHHPVAAVNWYHEEPNVLFTKDGECIVKASEAFDCWFGIDKNMLPFWKTKGFFLPPGYDPNIFKKENIAKIYDVSYIGKLGPPATTNMYWPYMKELAIYKKKALVGTNRPMGLPLLPKKLERFIRSKKRRLFLQKLPIWQTAWKNPQDEHEKALFINQSKIHFGLNRLRNDRFEAKMKRNLPIYPLDSTGLFYQLKARLFQSIGVGTMMLNEYCPELEELFVIDKEIITFKFGNFEEVRDKLKWYLKHDGEREKVAMAGYQRGQKCHSLKHRIEQILTTVKTVL
jgi:spore maturation protein CgeB